jgi:replicative superfamily II helicase
VKLPEIGKVRAERLWNCGFRTIQDIVADPDKLRATLNMKADKIMEIVQAAKGQQLAGLSHSDVIDML